jgi:hypothetical protein
MAAIAKQFENHTPSRDRITEAWENGNGNSIYV